jgi:benzylsuccinate CoA-transferase BbsF subunit
MGPWRSWRRSCTGRGQFIDLAQYESTLGVTGPYLLEYAANGTAPEPAGNHAREAAPHNAYRCLGDDRWCVIAVSTAEEWQALRRAMGEPAWAREERFATLEGRRAHEELLDHHLGEWTRQHTAEELMALLQSVGVPAGVVQNARDLLERDPHLRERGYFVTLEHPEAGPARYHRLAFQLSETPAQFRPAPLLGEHNDYVFGELLGLGEDEINHYIVEGIIE